MAIRLFPTRQGIRRIAFLAIGLGLAISIVWVSLVVIVRRLETAIWDRNDISSLAARQPFLETLASHPTIPKNLRNRTKGLLGDLAFGNGEYDKAQRLYLESFPRMDPMDPVSFSRSIAAGFTEFGRGFRDFQAGGATIVLANDDDFQLALPDLSPTRNAWEDYRRIDPLSEPDKTEARRLFGAEQPSLEDIAALCQHNRVRIESLHSLGDRLRLPDQDDPLHLVEIADFVRLLALDALSQIRNGDLDAAERSWTAAYRLIGFFEQNPRLTSCLVSLALRSTLANRMEGEETAGLARFFEPAQRCPEDFSARAIVGEYLAAKRLIAASFPGTDSVSQRLHDRVLNKQLALWRAVRAGGSTTDLREKTAQAISGWFFRNRRFIHRMDSGAYAEGQYFAAELEDLVAEIVHGIAVPNLGLLDRSLEELSERESELVRKSAASL